MKVSRQKWIDICRGLGIILVVFGHYMQTLHLKYNGIFTEIFYYIYSFHMPLFFFLSGFVYKKYTTEVFLKKKFKSLIVPLVTFTFLYTTYKYLIIGESIQLFDILICKSNSFIHLYWFIWTLLWTQIVYFFLDNIFGNNVYVMVISLVILMISMVNNYCTVLVNLPFCLGNVIVLLPFYVFGVIYKENENKFRFNCLFLILVTDILLCKIYNFGVSYALLAFDKWQIDYIKAILGIIIMVIISKKINVLKMDYLSITLQKIGRESLWIYLVHGFFFWGLFKKTLFFMPDNIICIMLYNFIYTILTIFIIYLTIYIYRRVKERIRFDVLQFEK